MNYFPLEGRALFVKKRLGYFTRITLLLNLPEPQGYLSQLCGVAYYSQGQWAVVTTIAASKTLSRTHGRTLDTHEPNV